ncbi:MAG: hypothetical protein ABSH34_07050 [Verrucomicrobiota bacterium]
MRDCAEEACHRYVEGFEDRIAYPAAEVPGLELRDPGNGLFCLEDFLRYCAVQDLPAIQQTI